MKYLLLMCLTVFSCCSGEETANVEPAGNVYHYNIVIVPDLSNRLDQNLYPRQLTDIAIIEQVANLFPNLLSSQGRLLGQSDKLSVKLLNPLEHKNFNALSEALTIDLGAFKANHKMRIDFRKNKGERTMEKAQANFMDASKKLYEASGNKGYGADIWGFFNQTLNEATFTQTLPPSNERQKHKSRNILILLTDGYIEVGNRWKDPCAGAKQCRYLTSYQLEALRKLTKYHGGSAENAFTASGMGIMPVKNPVLANTEVLVMEMYDRSRSKSGSMTKHPSDWALMKLFWEDFLQKSGAKKFKVVQACNTQEEAKSHIQKFLE